MAGIYSPIVTIFPDGVVTVASTDDTSYSQITQSAGSFIYAIDKIYMSANSGSQLIEPLVFTQYDVNGNIESRNQIQTIDPYQYQNSIFLNFNQKNIYLNGRNNFTFNILPNENILLVFSSEELSNKDFLEPTNFFNDDFFSDYTEIV
jgi:hypothetical protein